MYIQEVLPNFYSLLNIYNWTRIFGHTVVNNENSIRRIFIWTKSKKVVILSVQDVFDILWRLLGQTVHIQEDLSKYHSWSIFRIPNKRRNWTLISINFSPLYCMPKKCRPILYLVTYNIKRGKTSWTENINPSQTINWNFSLGELVYQTWLDPNPY